MAHQRTYVLRFLLFVLLLFGALWLVRFSPWSHAFSILQLRALVNHAGVFGFLVFIAVYSAGSVLSIPGTVLTFLGAILFGTALGTLLNVIGATIGATLAFLIARLLGEEFVHFALGEKMQAFEKRIQAEGFEYILLLRLIPVTPFFAINYCAGLTRIKLKDFVTATAIGIIPATFVYTYFFATIGEKTISGFALRDLYDIHAMIAGILFALLICVCIFYRHRLRRSHQ